MLLSHRERNPRNSQWIWVQATTVTFKNLFQQRGGQGSPAGRGGGGDSKHSPGRKLTVKGQGQRILRAPERQNVFSI